MIIAQQDFVSADFLYTARKCASWAGNNVAAKSKAIWNKPVGKWFTISVAALLLGGLVYFIYTLIPDRIIKEVDDVFGDMEERRNINDVKDENNSVQSIKGGSIDGNIDDALIKLGHGNLNKELNDIAGNEKRRDARNNMEDENNVLFDSGIFINKLDESGNSFSEEVSGCN